jgi:hypothetical protein
MSMKFRLPRPAVASRLKRRTGPIVAVLMAALVLVPSAASGSYTDPAGDSGAAGDITSVTVVGDKTSGQLVFRISGSNLATAHESPVWLSVDSDSNPLTGDLTDHGTDYWFGVGGHTYGFQHWNGSDWVDTPYTTVRVTSSANQVTISVNRSELGNASALNFIASTFSGPMVSTSGIVLAPGADAAPNDGAYNYSFEANGPQINSVDVQTTPSAGPRAGKRFVVLPVGLKLPPDGRTIATPVLPESYSCTAKLGAKQLAGSGTGGCTITVPKKQARGKRLTVQLTVTYQGATKVVPLTFKVT